MDLKEYLVDAKEKFEQKWKNDQPSNNPRIPSIHDFDMIRTIGVGAYGRVVLVKHKGSHSYYALKIQRKHKIMKLKDIDRALTERNILKAVNFPFIVNLEFEFDDPLHLYLVLEYVPGGELFTLLQKVGRLSKLQVRFYAAQVVLALEYLHYLQIIYRDLKPENLLINLDGYIKLSDFGFAKRFATCVWSLCGTPAYLAPEIILSKGYNTAADWWTLGIFIYEAAAGKVPFTAKDPLSLYDKIVKGKVKYPDHFGGRLKNLLGKLLEVDMTKRYGNLKAGVRDIKDHEWFSNLNWNAVFQKTMTAPFVPQCKGPGDSSNFGHFEEDEELLIPIPQISITST